MVTLQSSPRSPRVSKRTPKTPTRSRQLVAESRRRVEAVSSAQEEIQVQVPARRRLGVGSSPAVRRLSPPSRAREAPASSPVRRRLRRGVARRITARVSPLSALFSSDDGEEGDAADGLEDGLLAENASSPESIGPSSVQRGSSGGIEISPSAGEASSDDDAEPPVVSSSEPSPTPARRRPSVDSPAICELSSANKPRSLCVKCFKRLPIDPNIICDRSDRLSRCTVCKDLNKTCQSIPRGFKGQYDNCLAVAENAENSDVAEELGALVKKLGGTIDHFHSSLSKRKAEHDLLESRRLQYSQLRLQFLTLNELREANGKPALPESEMEIGFEDMYV